MQCCRKHKGIELLIVVDTEKHLASFLTITVLALLASLSLGGKANGQVLLHSGRYTVTASKVVQGNDTATAISADEIESNYRSDYHFRTPKEIQIKFSINGRDNEAPAGENHLLVIGSSTTQTFTFGKFAKGVASSGKAEAKEYLKKDAKITIRLDMTGVLAEMNNLGYYKTYDGNEVPRSDFKGVYVAGNTLPLSWDFHKLPEEPRFALHDSDNTGIYKVTILFRKEQYPGQSRPKLRKWILSKNVSMYPRYSSGSVLSEALYNMSLEEMVEDVRPDGAFMAGAMWPGVWTRDVSYSGLLSLAIIDPDAVKTSLLKKVKDDRIIQDTGTGGSWPVSSDRMVWTLAAWEVYKVTGDRTWLEEAYRIARNSAMDDLHTLVDPATGLFRGESTFLDWREQTYPRWMEPKDIFESEDLGTNAVQYETYQILAKMADALGQSPALYLKTSRRIKEGINKYMWVRGKGHYGQYRYGRNFCALSPRSESLGEALCVLFGVAGRSRAEEVLRNTPVTEFGATCIFPQTPGIPPYHDNAVWPFVESYWAWASSAVGNMASARRAVSAVYRAAAFFLTNKENMVATTGDYLGTQIDSDRQLWSVAGDLALVYRVLFGMRFHQHSLGFAPCIPEGFGGTISLDNFAYRKSILSITIKGYGDRVVSMALDGKHQSEDAIPDNLVGKHSVTIMMSHAGEKKQGVNLLPVYFAPGTPQPLLDGSELKWKPVKGATYYSIYRNGNKIAAVDQDHYPVVAKTGFYEYQVTAVAKNSLESFLSKPIAVVRNDPVVVVQAESNSDSVENKFGGYTGKGYVKLDLQHPDSPVYRIRIQTGGFYSIDVRYANGSGPINTSNKCAIRTLEVDRHAVGPVVMPQRGAGDWESWGYSNVIHVHLTGGIHDLSLSFDKHDRNMNGKTNTALVDAIRLTMISKR